MFCLCFFENKGRSKVADKVDVNFFFFVFVCSYHVSVYVLMYYKHSFYLSFVHWTLSLCHCQCRSSNPFFFRYDSFYRKYLNQIPYLVYDCLTKMLLYMSVIFYPLLKGVAAWNLTNSVGFFCWNTVGNNPEMEGCSARWDCGIVLLSNFNDLSCQTL